MWVSERGGHVSTACVSRRFAEYRDDLGLDPVLSPHPLRHTCATIALGNGVALHDLQDSLGQADPRTTRPYDRSRHKLAKSAGYDVACALA